MLWGAAVFAVRIVNEYYPPWLRWKTNLCLIRTPASCSDCCVSPSGFFSFSGLCWAQTLIYQMSCCMVVLDTFMLCCTLTKRSALTLWMRTPLQRWDLHMSYVLFQINNDKDMSDNVMSRCLLTFSMFCEGILLVYGVVSNTVLKCSALNWLIVTNIWSSFLREDRIHIQIPDLCKSG